MSLAGVEPCPVCGASLIPDAKCENCGHDPRILVCENCGAEGAKCRNCGADLTQDHHLVLRTASDNWVWKRCAYCDWAIEKYLYLSLGEIEPYFKPYEYASHSSGIESIIGVMVVIFLIAALVGPITNVLGPISANVTANHATNSTGLVSQQGFITLIQIFPVIFALVAVAVGLKMFSKLI